MMDEEDILLALWLDVNFLAFSESLQEKTKEEMVEEKFGQLMPPLLL